MELDEFEELGALPEGSIIENRDAVWRKKEGVWWALNIYLGSSSFTLGSEIRIIRSGPGEPWPFPEHVTPS